MVSLAGMDGTVDRDMFADHGVGADAHARDGRRVELQILRVAAHDGERMHHDAVAEHRVPPDDRMGVQHATGADLGAVLDDGGGMDAHALGLLRRWPGWPLRQQVELRVLQQIVVLQDADDLQRVGLAVALVDFHAFDDVEQHGAEGNDAVNAVLLEHGHALRAERLGGGRLGSTRILVTSGALPGSSASTGKNRVTS